jgi:hypothetical protein
LKSTFLLAVAVAVELLNIQMALHPVVVVVLLMT